MDDHLVKNYRSSTPTSGNLYERPTAVIPGGDIRSVTHHDPYPSFVGSGSGCRLRTEDGETLRDFLNRISRPR
jgi:glutamate-1-semialdehyde 2,1-aminomutase